MKATKTVQYNKCDFCNDNNECWNRCLKCGKDVCYDCEQTAGVTYRHAEHVGGSDDGWYCHECDAQPPDDLLEVYQSLAQLIAKREAYHQATKPTLDLLTSKIRAKRENMRREEKQSRKTV